MSLNLLSLETSGRSGSVAISCSDLSFEELQNHPELIDRIVTTSESLDPSSGSAKTLAPAIGRLLTHLGLLTKDLDAIAVVQGPGSFTGLRVGIATAKAMAYALGIPVVAVDTLDVIAHQVGQIEDRPRRIELIASVDAFRGQSFWGRYLIDGMGYTKVAPTGIEDNEVLASRIDGLLPAIAGKGPDSAFWVAGPSMHKLQECFDADASERISWIPCEPMAKSVASLGWRAWVGGQTEDVFGLLPMYYRSSAAEEKRST
jgi:tRNA threonylcarbamoyladenosine biosynthesis protein TsaB